MLVVLKLASTESQVRIFLLESLFSFTAIFICITGICDLPTNVHCNPDTGGSGGACRPGATEDVNSLESCDSFYQCINGENKGQFTCGSFYFNPSTGLCDLPANLDPPCENAEVSLFRLL